MVGSQWIFFPADALLLVVPCSWGTSKFRSSLCIMISAIFSHKEFFSIHISVFPALSSHSGWSEPLPNHSVYTECTGGAASNQRKQFVVVLVSVFNLTMSFKKEGGEGGEEKAIGLSQGSRGRRKRAASCMSRVSGQGAATAVESRIHNRFFLSSSDWYCCSKAARISFPPSTLWSHGKKASQGFDHHNYYKKQRYRCKE